MSSSTAGTVPGIPGVILALGSLWTQAIISVKGSKPLNSAYLQSLAVYQNTGDCSLLFSIAFFSVFAEITLHVINFRPVFGVQQGWEVQN